MSNVIYRRTWFGGNPWAPFSNIGLDHDRRPCWWQATLAPRCISIELTRLVPRRPKMLVHQTLVILNLGSEVTRLSRNAVPPRPPMFHHCQQLLLSTRMICLPDAPTAIAILRTGLHEADGLSSMDPVLPQYKYYKAPSDEFDYPILSPTAGQLTSKGS